MKLNLAELAEELDMSIAEAERVYALSTTVLEELVTEAKTPEQWEAIAQSIRDDKGLEAEYRKRGELARRHSWSGFRHFFWCWTGKELPAHSRAWFNAIIDQKRLNKTGTVIEAFRESAKTTIITIGFTAWNIGLFPEKENLLIQVGDGIAKDNSAKIAEIIERSPGWKYCFPYVEPDKESGWGDKGYFVKRTDITADNWQRQIAERKAPTLLGVGYGSDSIIGKHPTGLMVIDDIVNETNSSSERELKATLTILQGTIFFAITQQTTTIVIGTPWTENDVIDYCKKTGEFVHVFTPGYVEHDGVIEYTWEEERGREWVERKRRVTSSTEFARMIQLDLSKAGTQAYRYQSFPHMDIDAGWPMVCGVDPVATNPMVTGREGGISHFALSMVLKTPFNKAVIYDGIVEKCSADDGERHIVNTQRMYPNFERASIEIDGAGVLFASMVSRNAGVRFSTHRVGELPKSPERGKKFRGYNFLEPLFRNGLIMVSNADTPYLNRLRSYLSGYPNFSDTASEWDVADSLLMAIFDMPEVWTQIVTSADSETVRNIWEKPAVQKSPWAGIGRRKKR